MKLTSYCFIGAIASLSILSSCSSTEDHFNDVAASNKKEAEFSEEGNSIFQKSLFIDADFVASKVSKAKYGYYIVVDPNTMQIGQVTYIPGSGLFEKVTNAVTFEEAFRPYVFEETAS